MKLFSFIYYMLKKYSSLIVVTTVLMLSAFVGTANAVTTPTFPTCVNPQGEIKASYDNGNHGVAGSSNSYTGKDTVYSLSSDTQTQCLCPNDGNGIQTNWWKVSELSQEEISILVNQGWILIPNGSAWGLDDAPYLAQNINYSCTGSTSTTSSNSGNSSSENRVGGVSAESATRVFNLASTGNIQFILFVFLVGIAFISGGLLSAYKKRV